MVRSSGKKGLGSGKKGSGRRLQEEGLEAAGS
jgi:hypothetical protein